MKNNQEQRILTINGKGFTKFTEIAKKVKFAAAGENHFLYVNGSNQTYGFGSNKFGQLGQKDSQYVKQPKKVFQKHNIISIACGAEHTFFVNQKYEVYSCGLNIKGQLGHASFQNLLEPKLVVSLLPFGKKNPKSLNQNLMKSQTPPIVQALQRFELQIKMDEQSNQFVLGAEQYIKQISCGALFTVALSNQGRVFGCGLQGLTQLTNHQDQMEKSKFKLIQIDSKIQRIYCGLSGVTAISKDCTIYLWGKFGKQIINIPKKIKTDSGNNQQKFIDCKVGDEFAIFLNIKGELFSFGQNIDNQLGFDQTQITYKENPEKIPKIPLMSQFFVGRNTVYAVQIEKNQIYSWGSNKSGQLALGQTMKLSSTPVKTIISIQNGDLIIPTSYNTLFLTKKSLNFSKQKNKPISQSDSLSQKIDLKQYHKLLQQFQALKSLNLTLLQKIQPTSKKQVKQTQTYNKFQLEGVTQYRKFNSNTQIKWNQIHLQSQINQGGFGLIYRAKWRQITVVVKKFKIQNGDVSLRDFLSQCHAMEAVRHPSIVMFLGAVTTHPHYSIILQHCSKGSLWSYLQNSEMQISWEDRRRFAIQIAQGVLYLHLCTPPILHRDLKSLNIFLDSNLKIKIGDFGWTKTLDQYMTNKIGTYQWMAPEVIGNKPYTTKADVFSFSIIMWQIASREPPYKNISGNKVSEDVLNKDLRPPIPKKIPQSWVKLMKKCWDSDPARRPDFKEVIRQLQVMKL